MTCDNNTSSVNYYQLSRHHLKSLQAKSLKCKSQAKRALPINKNNSGSKLPVSSDGQNQVAGARALADFFPRSTPIMNARNLPRRTG